MINNIKSIKNKKILVIGDIILDHYINIVPRKISEEAPLLIFNYNDDYYSLGGAANVAKYLANFSCNVDIIGVVGNDSNAKIVLKELKNNHINTGKIIKDDNSITTIKTRFFSNDNKQVMRVDNEEKEANYKDIVIKELNKIDSRYDLIIVSDYSKGVINNDVFKRINEIAKKGNIKVICDPKNGLVDYKELYLLKPNSKEIIDIVGSNNDEEIIRFKDKKSIDNIVLTLGKDGMKVFLKDNSVINIPTNKSIVYDVTGAGDAVLAYMALGILLNMDFIEVCRMANYAASIKVSKFGTELVFLDEVVPFFKKKVIDRDSIRDFCNIIRRNKKIVFTNGCFDIIHSGHIHTLKEAKKCGDILILGLNSDVSIKGLKGNNRPILKEEERIEVLSSLEFIDYIVLFDVLVKGSYYKNKYIAGRKEVEDAGGKVVLIDLIDGKSTTNIIERIKESTNE